MIYISAKDHQQVWLIGSAYKLFLSAIAESSVLTIQSQAKSKPLDVSFILIGDEKACIFRDPPAHEFRGVIVQTHTAKADGSPHVFGRTISSHSEFVNTVYVSFRTGEFIGRGHVQEVWQINPAHVFDGMLTCKSHHLIPLYIEGVVGDGAVQQAVI